jgi:hypothetical protein
MTISPINHTLLPLDANSSHIEADVGGSANLAYEAHAAIGSPQEAASTPASEIADQELLLQDVWTSAPRTFDMDASVSVSIQGTPSSERLDQIAAHVLSYIT